MEGWLKHMKGPLGRKWCEFIKGQKHQEDFIAFSYLRSCRNILDVACGQGRFIEQDRSRISGIDSSSETVRLCLEKGYKVIQGDARKMPFEDEGFFGVHCAHLLEHFLPLDAHKLLSEMDRVLKPQGILIIRSPLLHSGFYDDFTHIKPYNPEAIMHYLVCGGQHTLERISSRYELLAVKWRYEPMKLPGVRLNDLSRGLNRFGFPWLKKNGYMLVLRKG